MEGPISSWGSRNWITCLTLQEHDDDEENNRCLLYRVLRNTHFHSVGRIGNFYYWEEWGISNANYVDTYNSYRASNGYTDHTEIFVSRFSASTACCIFIFQSKIYYSTEPAAAVKIKQRNVAVVLLANKRTRILISCSVPLLAVHALIRHQ